MSNTGSEFEHLMERVRTGDAEAARELFQSYGEAIQKVVRRRLSRRMRSEFDSLDFVQDAWASFFHIAPERWTFQTPEELMAFLTRLVQNKVVDAYRLRYQTKAHAPGHIQTLQTNTPNVAARQPTPSQVAIAEEEWDRMLQDKPPKLRGALEMLRAGYSRQEIAENLGLHPKTIQRLLQSMNKQMNRRASPP
jgi:RNA polymerase sigma-70 factor (ECF subfamily)